MNLPFDAILSYHLTPLTCGIARFNSQLAERLSLPLLGLFDPASDAHAHPLVSVKVAEMRGDLERLEHWLESTQQCNRKYSLFLHEYGASDPERKLVAGARRVYCGNGEIAGRLRGIHPDVIGAHCPGLVNEHRSFPEAELRVFSFGMANKLDAAHYERLRELLEASGPAYCLYLSTALHEGSRFEEVFETGRREFAALFGERLCFLGFLSDAAVAHYLRQCDYFAAFFPGGVRANNTSVLSAMAAGTPVITNLDAHSPGEFVHGRNVLDIDRLQSLPPPGSLATGFREHARDLSIGDYGWDRLLQRLRIEA